MLKKRSVYTFKHSYAACSRSKIIYLIITRQLTSQYGKYSKYGDHVHYTRDRYIVNSFILGVDILALGLAGLGILYYRQNHKYNTRVVNIVDQITRPYQAQPIETYILPYARNYLKLIMGTLIRTRL